MPAQASHTRLTALLLAVALLVGLAGAGTALAASVPAAEDELVSLVNAARASAGLPGLTVAPDLRDVARRHSARMAAEGQLHHNPNLGNEVTGWRVIGENVGVGHSARQVHDLFMSSPGHRSNILSRDFTEVGIGVEERDGRLWITEVFRLPASEPTPAPAPEPSEPAPTPTATTAPAPTEAPAPAPKPEPEPEPEPEAEPEPEPAPIRPASSGRIERAPAPALVLDRFTVGMARLGATETGGATSTLLGSLLDG